MVGEYLASNGSSAHESREHLMMFVIDVLKYDFETIAFTLDLLNDEGSVGWRFAWNGEFRAEEVIDALEELLSRRLVECYKDAPGYAELVRLEPPIDLRGDRESLWFRLTPDGRAAWERWDPPLDSRER